MFYDLYQYMLIVVFVHCCISFLYRLNIAESGIPVLYKRVNKTVVSWRIAILSLKGISLFFIFYRNNV